MIETGKGKFHLSITALKKISIIIGCIVFLSSVLSPFYCSMVLARIPMPVTGSQIQLYWSFKLEANMIGPFEEDRTSRQCWFSAYWFDSYIGRYLGLSSMIMMMSTAQILTLITGIASARSSRKVLALAPIVSCSTVITLMKYADTGLSRNTIWTNHEMGYVTDFGAVFLLNNKGSSFMRVVLGHLLRHFFHPCSGHLGWIIIFAADLGSLNHSASSGMSSFSTALRFTLLPSSKSYRQSQ